MQRNANMLKNLKKVRFCRFYWFLCRNAVPSLSPRTNFCPSVKLCNILYIKHLQEHKQALKKYFASESEVEKPHGKKPLTIRKEKEKDTLGKATCDCPPAASVIDP